MSNQIKNKGFSLTEILLATGVLAVGMLFIAGTFPVGIYFSTLATEQTLAAQIADEAFAKVQLYAVDGVKVDLLYFNKFKDFNDFMIFDATKDIQRSEFLYPSTSVQTRKGREYSWSAICRRISRIKDNDNDAALNTIDPNDPNYVDPNTLVNEVPAAFQPAVQVAVFICRKTGALGRYYMPNENDGQVILGDVSDIPLPVLVDVTSSGVEENEIRVTNNSEKIFFNDGCMIMDDETGRIYRVIERYRHDGTGRERILLLDRRWDQSNLPNRVWVVPPPIDGGRNPCIGIYQKVIKF